MEDNNKPDINKRVQRVERELRDIISSYMITQIGSEIEGLASITRVIVTRDLRSARVLVYNQAGEKIAKQNADVLQHHAHQINQQINAQIRMKYTPKITFLVDTKFDEAMKVEEKLRLLELERRANEKKSQTDDE